MEQDNRTITIHEISTAEQLKTVESLAWKIFPETYRDLIPAGQIPYMMKLMYDQAVLGKETHRRWRNPHRLYQLAYGG